MKSLMHSDRSHFNPAYFYTRSSTKRHSPDPLTQEFFPSITLCTGGQGSGVPDTHAAAPGVYSGPSFVISPGRARWCSLSLVSSLPPPPPHGATATMRPAGLSQRTPHTHMGGGLMMDTERRAVLNKHTARLAGVSGRRGRGGVPEQGHRSDE